MGLIRAERESERKIEGGDRSNLSGFGQTVGGFEAKEINGGLRWGARETEGVGWQRSFEKG